MIDTFNYYTQLPLWELTAVALSILYVVLAARNNKWCWPAAFLSTAIFMVIFYDVQLIMDSLLQVYYLFMAVYGWWVWQSSRAQSSLQTKENDVKPIEQKTLMFHIKAITGLTVLSLILGYVMANYSSADYPYLDTTTTVFAIFATYLVAQRILENWLYWVVIDAVSIYLYINKALLPTAVLFVLFVIFSVYGYVRWLSIYRQQTVSTSIG